MQLAVNQFYKYQPASKWAFEVQFSNPMLVYKTKTASNAIYSLKSSETFTQKDLERISQAVVSITQPKYDIEAFTNCYGNFDFVIPIYDVNNIRLTVTFEDTDDCLISYKFLTSLMGGSKGDSGIPAWLNIHETILLTIKEYNTYNYDVERPNTFETQKRNYNNASVKSFFCKMIEYTEPNYNRTSEDAHATTMTITFLAIPAQPMIVDDRPILTNGVEEVDVKKELAETTKAVTDVFKTIGYTLKSAVGWMADKAVNLKDVYADMMEYFGDTFPASRAEVQDWFTHYALSDNPLGQCTRGQNMLNQLYEYIESGEAKKGVNRMYVSGGKASEFKNNVGIKADTTKTIVDTTNTTFVTKEFATVAELNTAIRDKLKPGEYVTFEYTHTDGKNSQHIVSRSFDGKETWSDFNQKSQSGVSGTNVKITGSFQVQDKKYTPEMFGVKTEDVQKQLPLGNGGNNW
jgi:hypothetical protein